MKEIKIKINNKMKIATIILSFVSILSFNFLTIADLIVKDFNGINPQNHIYKIYETSYKEELKNGDIKYENIEDMIHLYNPDILNNWNLWENNKSQQDIYDDYMDAADDLYDSASGQDSSLQEGMMKAQADAMRIQADKNVSDSYINFLSYYMAEKNLVLSTKITDLNFQKSYYELKIAEENLEETKRKELTAQHNYNYGNGTQVDLLTARKSVSDANSALVSASSAQSTAKRTLIINCGRSMQEDVNILPVNIECGYDIANIKFEDDYEIALKNNFQYEIYKKSIENARTTEVKNEYEILLNSAPQNIYNDLDSKYHAIMDALDTQNNRQIAIDLANATLNNAINSYKSGSISEKEYNSAKYAVNVAKYNFEVAKYDVMIAYETYKAAVAGLASC